MRSKRGFALAHVMIMAAVIALAIGGMLTWLVQSRAALDGHATSRQFEREKMSLQVAVHALVRKNILDNNPTVLAGIDLASLKRFETIDPRFNAAAPSSPGIRLSGLSAPTSPTFFLDSDLESPKGGSPLDGLRQKIHSLSFPAVLTHRRSEQQSASELPSKQVALQLKVREIPVSAFSLVALEDSDLDSGLVFEGTALTLGKSTRNAAEIRFRISPNKIPDAQMGLNEKVWESPSLAGGLLSAPGTLFDPNSAPLAGQNLARRGKLITFDGHAITSDVGSIPGVEVRFIDDCLRVVVDLNAVAQSNIAIDPDLPLGKGNEVSAFHIECTTLLAKDRGIVVMGTSSQRVGDFITTNGAILLSGNHTGGPAFIGSSFGGARFLNTGNVEWNAFLALLPPSPRVSGATDIIANPQARQISLSVANSLTAEELAFDSVTFAFTGGLMRLRGFQGTGGVTLNLFNSPSQPVRRFLYHAGQSEDLPISPARPVGAAAERIEFTISRSQKTTRVRMSDGSIFYHSLPLAMSRIEFSEGTFPAGTISPIIVSSGTGASLGGNAGTITLRGILTTGMITRYGDADFLFRPSPSADLMERIVPRIIVIE